MFCYGNERFIIPLSDERERLIGAVRGADLFLRAGAPIDDRSEHGIDPPLELRGPPPCGLERRLEVEGGVEARLLAHQQPRLADQHRPNPSVLQGEPSQDVDQALLGQLGPVRAGLSHCFFVVDCFHFRWSRENKRVGFFSVGAPHGKVMKCG